MKRRRLLRLPPFLAVCLALLLAPSPSARGARPEPETLTVGYLAIADDPRHAERRSYANLVLREAIHPYQGAETALREARVLGRAIGIRFGLERLEGKSAEDLLAAVEDAASRGIRLFLLDAPAEVVAEVARRTRGRGLALFNVSAMEDRLRGAECQPHLFHIAPSLSMLTDALAQHAASRKWTDILVLRGEKPEDAALAEGFARSARRFGLRIVATRPFTQSNDPRERERNNIALLTADADYDLIFVADAEAELGRQVPYQSQLPRPVIGSQGLVPTGWHWSYERHGAPQLNQRFERAAGRRMRDADWAAWAAMSLITKAAAATRSADPDRLLEHLRGEGLTFDTYKGAPGSFRSWDNQLRQPVLLHTADAVVARAPITGFLHAASDLDTLGRDRPETECRFR